MSNKDEIYERMKQHGENLKAIFEVDTDAVELSVLLRRIELFANRNARAWCNGDIDEKKYNFENVLIESAICDLLGFCALDIVFINSDPRGYSLKIESEVAKDMNIHRDMGGYGILSPDFS